MRAPLRRENVGLVAQGVLPWRQLGRFGPGGHNRGPGMKGLGYVEEEKGPGQGDSAGLAAPGSS